MKSIEIERLVEEQHLAVNMKSGSLEVLATPQMIAWMEEAACLCLDMEEGFTSVGTMMNVTHEKASPKGAMIRIRAEILQIQGRMIHFKVSAYQNDFCIGKGEHQRFIVNAKKFVDKTYA